MVVEMFVEHVAPFGLGQLAERRRYFSVEFGFAQLLGLLNEGDEASFLRPKVAVGFDYELRSGRAIFLERFVAPDLSFDNCFQDQTDEKIWLRMLVRLIDRLVRHTAMREHFGDVHFTPPAFGFRRQCVDTGDHLIGNAFGENVWQWHGEILLV